MTQATLSLFIMTMNGERKIRACLTLIGWGFEFCASQQIVDDIDFVETRLAPYS
jgi:hypothetical protein